MIFSTVMGTLISFIFYTKIGACFLTAVSLSCLMHSIRRGSSKSFTSLSSSTATIYFKAFSQILCPWDSDSSKSLVRVESFEELVLIMLFSLQTGSKLLDLCIEMQDFNIRISSWRDVMTSCCLAITRWKLMETGEVDEMALSCCISELRLFLDGFINKSYN